MSNKTNADQQSFIITEALKESVKAKIAGRIFKMKEFKEMEANPDHYEAEILRWKTSLEKTIAEKDSSIAKKHQYLWHTDDGKSGKNYPTDGVPQSKVEFNAIIKHGRLGQKWRKAAPSATAADTEFDAATIEISGGLYTEWKEYRKDYEKIHKAVEQARYIIGTALNNEMHTPFMKGYYRDYTAIIEWIDKKTKFENKIEYMFEIFEKLSNAVDEPNHADTKCMNFRMAMERLYIDEEIEFPDWENDRQAQLLDAENWSPSLSHVFLWQIQRRISPATWKKIEDEFRAEIGNDNYNRIGWQRNKTRLYKLIDKHTKNGQDIKAQIHTVQPNNYEKESDSDEMEIELDDGMILRVQPKSRNAQGNWRQNVTKKFDLKQNGQRWQKINRSNTNSGKTINRKSPDPNGTWNCRMCINEGKPCKVKNSMKCPTHRVRPGYLKDIPLSGRMNTVEQPKNNQSNDESQEDSGKFNSIKARLYGDTDTE